VYDRTHTIESVPEIEDHLKNICREYHFWRILEEFVKENNDDKKKTSEGSKAEEER
jgi:hypothetical protein